MLFPTVVITPDGEDYEYLLKCSIKPVCLTPNGEAKIDFDSDLLATQALIGLLTFQGFKSAVTAKDNAVCETTETNGTTSSPYYTIDANIVLEADAIAVLDKIGPLYFAKTKEKFNVNSGIRSAYRQAAAMYIVYMSGDKILSQYSRWKANEMLAIIKKGESKTVTVQKMAEVIQKYFEKGTLFSDHQQAGAIDIAIVGDIATRILPMSGPNQKIMMEIAKEVTGFSALRETKPLHIHIKFK